MSFAATSIFEWIRFDARMNAGSGWRDNGDFTAFFETSTPIRRELVNYYGVGSVPGLEAITSLRRRDRTAE
jgi:hypothetical protein